LTALTEATVGSFGDLESGSGVWTASTRMLRSTPIIRYWLDQINIGAAIFHRSLLLDMFRCGLTLALSRRAPLLAE
jgi:hypothetical protein